MAGLSGDDAAHMLSVTLDGLSRSDPLVLPRKSTRELIVDILSTKPSLLIVSPPASGKTSLIQLLHADFDRFGNWCWLSGVPFRDDTKFDQAAAHVVAQVTAKFPSLRTLDDVLNNLDLLVFDDAQMVYPSTLFDYCIKKPPRAKLLAFASYGLEALDYATPAFFSTKVVTQIPFCLCVSRVVWSQLIYRRLCVAIIFR